MLSGYPFCHAACKTGTGEFASAMQVGLGKVEELALFVNTKEEPYESSNR